MAPIPDELLVHTAVVEPYEGEAGTGPAFGAPVTVPCFREDARRQVRDQLGELVVSECTLYARPGTVAPPKSRVTTNGRTAFVITVKDRDSGTAEEIDHVEVRLT
ncbi:hypothetical protein [Saccharothrix sp. HUAS TT1]|uniref:hypothetical protein n=1 Tax=unclassified Saccharothrix TaxID=2593673 RepID=UPI00345B8C05